MVAEEVAAALHSADEGLVRGLLQAEIIEGLVQRLHASAPLLASRIEYDHVIHGKDEEAPVHFETRIQLAQEDGAEQR